MLDLKQLTATLEGGRNSPFVRCEDHWKDLKTLPAVEGCTSSKPLSDSRRLA